jgi:hypothetical protein
MKISNPGKYIVETVRDEHYDSYHCSYLELSGRRFFGFPYALFLARDLNIHFSALAAITMVPPCT